MVCRCFGVEGIGDRLAPLYGVAVEGGYLVCDEVRFKPQ
jgi:hypothetical protein